MNYWLMKNEPEVFGIEELRQRPNRTEHWDGVRNYQARNYMRDMEKGDLALFYHSNCKPPGVAGLMEITREAYPDHTAQAPDSPYYDPKASPENPRWYMVDVTWRETFEHFVALEELRARKTLSGMKILQKGNRLSITPVTKTEFDMICRMGRA